MLSDSFTIHFISSMALKSNLTLYGIALLCLFCCSIHAKALERLNHSFQDDLDTNYIHTFYEQMNARLYLSRKFTNLGIVGTNTSNGERRLDYEPNSTVNLGVGFTYKGFTLNLGYGFSFLNEEEGRGETTYLDLQTHKYGRKYALDLFAQLYRGMYLSNAEAYEARYSDDYYLRPDIGISMFGAGYMRVLNHERFSYAASLVQSEYQKQSAGSFLIGGKLILFGAESDSSMVPNWSSDSLFESFKGVQQMSAIQLGPGIGYAHTFVLRQHWFLTLSLELNLMLGPVSYALENGKEYQRFQVNASPDLKMAAGYNSETSYFGLMVVDNRSNLHSIDGDMYASFGVGNIRLNYVKRFDLSPKWKKRLEILLL